MPDIWELINKTTDGYNKRFPGGNDPFKIVCRITEEVGEIAQQVNHFENQGVKQAKMGDPDREHLAKEVKDTINTVMQLVRYYKLEPEVGQAFQRTYDRMKQEQLV